MPSLGDAVAERRGRACRPRPCASGRRGAATRHRPLGRDCDCVPDGDWKGPLRSALDRLAGGVDAGRTLAADLPGRPDPWAARDAYVDVSVGVEPVAAFVGDRLATRPAAEDGACCATVLEAQRWRLAMFASCAWFWDVPDRIETAGALRAAVRAARLMDALPARTSKPVDRPTCATVHGEHVDGTDLVQAALSVVGAPPSPLQNPSARDLRATG